MDQRIGHYQIVSELGRGGMGVVYKAHEQSLNRFVAIKLLGEHLEEDETYVRRFIREAQSAAKLNHPNIVQIYSISEEGGRHFFVMEYVSGTSLQRMIRSSGKMETMRACRIILQAAAGLSAAHEQGVVHRDIKPANLLIDDRGLVKIADFGLALMASTGASRLTATGMFMGTPGYLSPEQCLDKDIDHRTDIYSLGVTFFEALTGSMPFRADSPLALLKQILEVEPPDVRDLNPDVAASVREVLQRMMAKDRDQRYADCKGLINDLQSYLAGIGTPEHEIESVTAGTTAAVVPSRPATPAAALAETEVVDRLNTSPTVQVASGAGDLDPTRAPQGPPPRPVTSEPTVAPQGPPPPPVALEPTIAAQGPPPAPSPPRRADSAPAPPAAEPQAPPSSPPPLVIEEAPSPPPARRSAAPLLALAAVVLVAIAGAAAVGWKLGLFERGAGSGEASQSAALATSGGAGSQGESGIQPLAGSAGSAAEGPATESSADATATSSSSGSAPDVGSAGASVEDPGLAVGASRAGSSAVGPEPGTNGGATSAATTSGSSAPTSRPSGGGDRVPPPSTAGSSGGARSQMRSEPQSEPRQPPRPVPKGVVVVAVGERLLAGTVEAMLERGLDNAGVLVVDERGIPSVMGLADEGARPIELVGALRQHARYMLLIRAEYLGERMLAYMGRQEPAFSSRLTVTPFDLAAGTALGPGMMEDIEYTKLNVERVVARDLRAKVRALIARVEDE